MKKQKRQKVERAVFREVCSNLIAAGYHINPDTGDNEGGLEFPGKGSQDIEALTCACFYEDGAHCDEWTCLVYDQEGKRVGSFYCVTGNEGYDLISDYNESLDMFIDPVATKWEVRCESK